MTIRTLARKSMRSEFKCSPPSKTFKSRIKNKRRERTRIKMKKTKKKKKKPRKSRKSKRWIV